MGRAYPRFLYSNPINTKSEGPFIVHLLKPRFIVRMLDTGDGNYKSIDHINALHYGGFSLEVLEVWDPEKNSLEVSNVLNKMADWLVSNNYDVTAFETLNYNLLDDGGGNMVQSKMRFMEPETIFYYPEFKYYYKVVEVSNNQIICERTGTLAATLYQKKGNQIQHLKAI